MEVRSLTLGAGQRVQIDTPGRFFMLVSTPGGGVDVSFVKERSTSRETGRAVEAGYKSFPDPTQPGDALIQSFDGVVITSPAAQTIRYAISDRQGDYGSISQTVVVTQAAGVATIADATVGVAAGIVAPQNLSRRNLLLVNGAQPIRIGDSNVTATRGVRVGAGASITLSTTAAVYAIREGATDSIVTMTEETA